MDGALTMARDRRARAAATAFRPRPAPGGGRQLELAPHRIPGWINRFAAGHGGLAELRGGRDRVVALAADGTSAIFDVPFPPQSYDPADTADTGDTAAPGPQGNGPEAAPEPVEALLDHLAALGELGIILVRAGAHSVGVAEHGRVTVSSTDTHYVQGRTAAGGWSQQRYARRRDNQLTAAQAATAAAAERVLLGRELSGLVVGGDERGATTVLELLAASGPAGAALTALPRREFWAVPEPRRTVLDEVAAHSLDVTVTVTPKRTD